MDVKDEVTQILAAQLKVPAANLTPETRLEDLGVESLDLIEIVFELESKFDISIPLDPNDSRTGGGTERARFETIDDVVNGVKAAIAAAGKS